MTAYAIKTPEGFYTHRTAAHRTGDPLAARQWASASAARQRLRVLAIDGATVVELPALLWAMTNPHPWKRAHVHGADDGRIGWRWHGVPIDGTGAALCGVRARHGWGADLFANELCERCRRIAVRRGLPIDDGLKRSALAEYIERKQQKLADER